MDESPTRGKRLYRSRENKVFMGLSGGLGSYFNVDPTIIRIIFVVLEFLTAGLLIFGYFIVALFIPKEPVGTTPAP